jgi:hypothetical protein
METIRLDEVLKEFDNKEKGNVKDAFSIVIVLKSGERRKLNKAVKVGQGFSLKNHEMRGVLEVDENGKSKGHPTPVSIWAIPQYNDKKVIL